MISLQRREIRSIHFEPTVRFVNLMNSRVAAIGQGHTFPTTYEQENHAHDDKKKLDDASHSFEPAVVL